MPADAAAAPIAVGATMGAQAPISPDDIWEVDAVPLQASIEDDPAARIVVLLVVGAGRIVHQETRAHLSGEPAQVAKALSTAISAASRATRIHPRCVRVRFAEFVPEMARRLSRDGMTVELCANLPNLEHAARDMMRALTDIEAWPPLSGSPVWRAWGLPRAAVAALYEAAAEFWRAAPWLVVANEQAPELTCRSERTWTACVLGNAGEEFGVALYSEPTDLFDQWSVAGSGDSFAHIRGRVISLTYDAAEQLNAGQRREMMRSGLEIADSRAVPYIITVNTPGGGISQVDAADLIDALRALPGFARKHERALRREQRTGLAGAHALTYTDAPNGAMLRYDWRLAQLDAAADRIPDEADAEFDDEGSSSVLPPEFEELVSEVVGELGPDAAADDVLRILNDRMPAILAAHNRAGQADLGGLSPEQVRELLQADWVSPGSALRIVPVSDRDMLDRSDFLVNVRTLLDAAAAVNGLGATAAGNLKLAVVAELLDRIRLDPELRRIHVERYRRITEADVRPLNVARIVAELAGLLRRRGGRFIITNRGEDLRSESGRGRLQAELFQSYFRAFNLAYGSRLPDWPELQDQVGFTLYRLQALPTEWRTSAELADLTILPHALSVRSGGAYDLSSNAFEHHVLDPLVSFGLMECSGGWRERIHGLGVKYRQTPLLHAMVSIRI